LFDGFDVIDLDTVMGPETTRILDPSVVDRVGYDKWTVRVRIHE
jgi:hypothetical protein